MHVTTAVAAQRGIKFVDTRVKTQLLCSHVVFHPFRLTLRRRHTRYRISGQVRVKWRSAFTVAESRSSSTVHLQFTKLRRKRENTCSTQKHLFDCISANLISSNVSNVCLPGLFLFRDFHVELNSNIFRCISPVRSYRAYIRALSHPALPPKTDLNEPPRFRIRDSFRKSHLWFWWWIWCG